MIVTRKKHFMKSRRQLWAGAMFLLAMVTLGAFIFAYAKPKLARRSSGSIAIPVQDPAKSVSTKERIATELIVLGPNGFEPATLTRTPGKFLLAIDNRTGLNGLTFELDGVDGTRQRAALLADQRIRWREVVDLSLGDYLVRVVGHTKWSCRIRITEK